MNKLVTTLAVIATAGFLAGCGASNGDASTTSSTSPLPDSGATRAVAVIHPASDSNVHGTVWFQQTSDGVRITADLSGLTPGPHGFHIHEYGDCSAADASSAGGHYNPEGNPHGAPDAARHHAGDFGNIHANDQGEAHMKTTVGFISIDAAHNPILGRAVVVHAGQDDLTSQPSGAAGARVGCGVIGLAKAK